VPEAQRGSSTGSGRSDPKWYRKGGKPERNSGKDKRHLPGERRDRLLVGQELPSRREGCGNGLKMGEREKYAPIQKRKTSSPGTEHLLQPNALLIRKAATAQKERDDQSSTNTNQGLTKVGNRSLFRGKKSSIWNEVPSSKGKKRAGKVHFDSWYRDLKKREAGFFKNQVRKPGAEVIKETTFL